MNLRRHKWLLWLLAVTQTTLPARAFVELDAANAEDLLAGGGLDIESKFGGLSTAQAGTLSEPDEQGNSLLVIGQSTDDVGGEHKRVRQYFNGLSIWGADVIQHVKPDGTKSFTGNYFDGLSDILGEINPDDFPHGPDLLKQFQSETLALYTGQSSDDVKISDVHQEAMVYQDEDDQTSTTIAYYIHFFIESKSTGEPKRPHYIINAADLSIIKQWEGLSHTTSQKIGKGPGGNAETGQYSYGSGDWEKFPVTRDGQTCTLETENVKTIDMGGSTSDDISNAFEFSCPEQSSDTVNGAYSPLNDAHYFGNVVFNMYKDWFDVDVLSTQLVMRVHYGSEYENAFWNGELMTFGDGKDDLYPLVALDVVAHEVTHGFTEQNSALVYRGESGGVNEAFSDMAGKAAEFYQYGNVKEWTVGQDITKDDKPLRYLDDPTKDSNSIASAADYTKDMDVHYSSGIFNKVFYILANSDGWDTKKAFSLFFCANRNYWTSTSSFLQAAKGVLNCADDLEIDASVIESAFKAVAVSQEDLAANAVKMCSCECTPEQLLERVGIGRKKRGAWGLGPLPFGGFRPPIPPGNSLDHPGIDSAAARTTKKPQAQTEAETEATTQAMCSCPCEPSVNELTSSGDCFSTSNSSSAQQTISYFDDDGDGKISSSENQQMAENCENVNPGCSEFQLIWFELFDMNLDGYVTADEIVTGESNMDINQDGLVCDSETPEGMENYEENQSVYRRY